MFRPILVTVLLLVCASAVIAQEPIEGLLQDLAQTDAQRAIARVLETICPSGQISDALLQLRCNQIVGEAFRQGDLAGVRQALQALAPEENLVVGSSLVDSAVAQVDAVQQRLANVRSGGGGQSSFALNLGGWQSLSDRRPKAIAAPLFSVRESSQPATLPGGGYGSEGDRSPGHGGSQGPDDVLETNRRWGFFASATSSSLDRTASARTAGFQADQTGIIAGLDYLVTSRFVLGGALGYKTDDSVLDSSGGSVDSDSLTFSIQTSWFGPRSSWFEAVAGLGKTDIDQSRLIRYNLGDVRVDLTAVGSTESTQVFASVATGWDLARGALSFSPEIGFDYLESAVDGFAESNRGGGNLGQWVTIVYEDQRFSSLTGQLGVQVGYNVSTSFGVFIPQFNAAFIREFDDSAETVLGSFAGDSLRERYSLLTDEADSSYGRVGLGAVFVFSGGKACYFFYGQRLAYEDLDLKTFNIGFRLGA